MDLIKIVKGDIPRSAIDKGCKGYLPMAGHLAENGLVAGDAFRRGNEAPASWNLAFIRYCQRQLPKGKKITALRADSASYQAEMFNDRRAGICCCFGIVASSLFHNHHAGMLL